MSATFVVIVLGIGAAIAAAVTMWRHGRPADLGVVSHQWIAEHRFGRESDTRR